MCEHCSQNANERGDPPTPTKGTGQAEMTSLGQPHQRARYAGAQCETKVLDERKSAGRTPLTPCCGRP